ncbi:MAG: DNA-processing protein DprA [Polyangiaceae bacterium]
MDPCIEPAAWRTVAPDSSDYPAGVRELAAAPGLWVVGTTSLGLGVTIVGTRQPSPAASAFARELAGAFAKRGVVGWSGGAVGIDAAAHEGALESKGATVAVLAGGFEHLYPREHQALFERVVAQGGALLTRAPPDHRPLRAAFLARNQILAAATPWTFVVECNVRSGARSTAHYARELGRQIGVVLQAPWAECGQGCAEEARLGATPVLGVEHALALHSGASWSGRPRRAAPRQLTLDATSPQGGGPGAPPPAPLEPEQARVVAAITAGAATIDALCAALALDAARAAAILTELSLLGVVTVAPAGVALAVRSPTMQEGRR